LISSPRLALLKLAPLLSHISYNAAASSAHHAAVAAVYPELAATHGTLVRGLHEISRCFFSVFHVENTHHDLWNPVTLTFLVSQHIFEQRGLFGSFYMDAASAFFE
jgi:hypothetical protein